VTLTFDMTLKFNSILVVVKVHIGAKFVEVVECRGTYVRAEFHRAAANKVRTL